ncbi:hypothetical protein HBB16_10065 [Pseudonocardia sp. MCCB 268]|nr:hypothetical protein [Pseudonocardia cytotoxica]
MTNIASSTPGRRRPGWWLRTRRTGSGQLSRRRAGRHWRCALAGGRRARHARAGPQRRRRTGRSVPAGRLVRGRGVASRMTVRTARRRPSRRASGCAGCWSGRR